MLVGAVGEMSGLPDATVEVLLEMPVPGEEQLINEQRGQQADATC